MSLSPGIRLGPYEVTALIGEGGMGKVWRAHHTALNRDDALKVLPDAFASDPERLARFRREAQVLASLNHPNIAHVYGLEQADGMQALVMELVEGPTLADRIAEGPIPVDEALPIAKQIAEALEAAHDQGIIHRDLKPANVKLRVDGTVKVLDFGLAKAVEPTHVSRDATISPTVTSPAMMTGIGVLLGTAAYMAPEQAKGRPADKRSDIWAFGCVLYEMLAGTRPFDGEDISDTLAAVLRGDPDWTVLPANIPTPIRKLLRRCLEKDRKRRLESAADARLEIEEALIAPTTDASTTGTSGARHWIIEAALVIALLAVSIPATRYFSEAPPVVAPEMRVEISTPATASPLQFALSPDGLKLAFVASANGAQRLWFRSLDKATAQPLPGTEGAQYPFWSPDGRSVGFFASGKLYRVDIAGGAPQALADASQGRGGAWNRDGVIVFAPTNPSPLMRVAASGGKPVPLTKLDLPRSTNHRFPQFLPDGRHFLFYAQGSAAGIYLGTLDTGDPKLLMLNDTAGAYLAPGRLVYLRQGTLMARRLDVDRGELTGDPEPLADSVDSEVVLSKPGFSVSADGQVAYRVGTGRSQLNWYDRTGKALGVGVEADVIPLQYAELSPDGRRVAADRLVQDNRDVWLLDLDRGGMTRFTFDPAMDGFAAWSPDGMRIVFRSTRKGPGDLYVKASSGAGAEQLVLETPNDKLPQDWSRDGHFLLYSELDPKTAGDLKALPLEGNERKAIVVVNTPFDERGGQFSPDGRWVAYATNESGRYEIVVQPFPQPSGKWQVSIGGGLHPRWRADGRELYFIAPDGNLMAASLNLSIATFASAAPMALFQTRILGGGTNLPSKPYYMVSRDGRFLILESAADAGLSPIVLLLNWKPQAE